MRYDLVAEHQHYYDHLLPIWNALPESVRGVNWGVTGESIKRIDGDTRVLVAGYNDVIRYSGSPVVYVEHGAGQSYIGLPAAVAPFYSPLVLTKQHRNVIAYLCPNDEVAARWSRSYDRPTFVVGCPKLDPWHARDRGQHEPRTVAVTFHWQPPVSVWSEVPELLSAWDHYCLTLPAFVRNVRADGWHVIFHQHPRWGRDLWQPTVLKELGVEFVAQGSEVLDRASILIADNTSLSAEFMSLGRGVVWLNHPAYRRDVEHGGRYWQWPRLAGVQVDTPASLVALDLDSVPASAWHPYAYADGHAAERASEYLLALE